LRGALAAVLTSPHKVKRKQGANVEAIIEADRSTAIEGSLSASSTFFAGTPHSDPSLYAKNYLVFFL
jgi:hypothetical protein